MSDYICYLLMDRLHFAKVTLWVFEALDDYVWHPIARFFAPIYESDGEATMGMWLTETSIGERLLRWLCMWNGHASVYWYNPGGMEPDMRCQRCGEDLG